MFHGYYVIIASFLLKFVGIGIDFSSAVFLLPLELTFNITRAKAALLGAIWCSVGLLTSMFSGTIQSYFAKRYGEVNSVKPMIRMGATFIGLGNYLSSVASNVSLVLICGVITGIGIGLTAYTCSGICVQWFEKANRGQMLLLASTGSGFGSFTFTKVMGVALVKLSEGDSSFYSFGGGDEAWRIVMKWSGLLGGLVGLMASFVMRLPHHLEVEIHEKPGDDEKEGNVVMITKDHLDVIVDDEGNDNEAFFGESPSAQSRYGSIASSNTLSNTLKNSNGRNSDAHTLSMVAEKSIRAVSFISQKSNDSNIFVSIAEYESIRELPIDYTTLKESTMHESTLSLSRALNTRTSISVLLSCAFVSFGLMPFYEHLPAFAVGIGLSEEQGTRILSLTGVFMILGNVTGGFVVNRFGSIWILRILLLLLSCLNFAWPHCTSISSLQLVAILYGASTSLAFNLPLVIIADAFGSASPTTILHLSGILNVVTAPGYLSGPSIVGHFYDVFGSYDSGSMWTGCCLFLGFFSLLFCVSPDEQKRRLGL